MLVTQRNWEKDVAVAWLVERDKALRNDIRIKSQFHFMQVFLPQVVSGHFLTS